MDAVTRIERALNASMDLAAAPGSPPRLAEAMRYAVFPRGARIRPRLCLAVAGACGDDQPGLTDAAAASIELLHCASLVHDDLPCFDDAETRRGRPSVHRAYGQPLAVLAGDALIVLAFQIMARASVAARGSGSGGLLLTIGDSVGMPVGIVAGQGWESEPALRPGRSTSGRRPARCSPRPPRPARRRPAPRPGRMAAARRPPGRGLPGGRRPARRRLG